MQQEQPALGLALLDLGIRREVLEAELHRQRFMALLGFGQVEQQLLHLRIPGAFRRLAVEAVILELNHFRPLAHLLDIHLADGPGRLVAHEPSYVAAPDQRHEVAEFLLVEIGEPAPVLVLLLRHFHEHLGGSRIGFHQRMGKPRISARVVVLAGNRQRQQFLLGEVGEAFQECPHPLLQGATLESFQTMVQFSVAIPHNRVLTQLRQDGDRNPASSPAKRERQTLA